MFTPMTSATHCRLSYVERYDMPRYKVTVWSKTRPNVRQQKIIVKRSVINAIHQTSMLVTQLQYSAKLPDRDLMWTVERMSGHLNMWVIAASSNQRKVTTNATTH